MISVYLYDMTMLDDSYEFNKRCERASTARLRAAGFKYGYDKNASGQIPDSKLARENIGASAVLDEALGKYGLCEKDIRTGFGPYGKPYLQDYPDIHFNLSHSGRYVICAIGSCELGIDIQQSGSPHLKAAKRFFCENEYNWIINHTDNESIKSAFYRIWTLKESFVKTVGSGMNISFDKFEVIIQSGPQASECSKGIMVRQNFDERKFIFSEMRFDDYFTALCITAPCKEINVIRIRGFI